MAFATFLVCSLDYTFNRSGCAPSSLYTFLVFKVWLGIPIFKGFTEFEAFYSLDSSKGTQIMVKSDASAISPPSHFYQRTVSDTNRHSLYVNRKVWERWDSNPQPSDYACHYDFRHQLLVCGLDYAFTIAFLL
jgi:hypothetical protein